MMGIRYENYINIQEDLPFVLHTRLERTALNLSREKNWHENIEIQLCLQGNGAVLLNGKKYRLQKDTVVIVNSNVIHYTYTDEKLVYACLIVDTRFCKYFGIDERSVRFEPYIVSEKVTVMMYELIETYLQKDDPLRKMRTTEILLRLFTELCRKYSLPVPAALAERRDLESVKQAVTYIRRNYVKKITLDELAKEVLSDKYRLCREFKRLTGQTVINYVNRFRCEMVIEYLSEGGSVSEAAHSCGFENLSFFTRTFKKIYGELPSEMKQAIRKGL